MVNGNMVPIIKKKKERDKSDKHKREMGVNNTPLITSVMTKT